MESVPAALRAITGNGVNVLAMGAFYVPEAGLYRTALKAEGYSELCNAFAVLCGAAKGAVAKSVCKRLAKGIGLIPATLSMKAFTYDAMLKTDGKAYKEWILSDIDKTYSTMLIAGATSFWETIEGAKAFQNAGSLCHGWSAMPIVYYRKLLLNEQRKEIGRNEKRNQHLVISARNDQRKSDSRKKGGV